MIRLDHLAIPVRDQARSRTWYAQHFGFRVAFEVPERKTVALQDDVEATYRELSQAGIVFEKAPQKLYRGYGAELRDPDGYLVYVWDQRSMCEKGNG
jgi:catechol 2,3-dioxygenase-like lactoylglutathione lyase family enzyme